MIYNISINKLSAIPAKDGYRKSLLSPLREDEFGRRWAFSVPVSSCKISDKALVIDGSDDNCVIAATSMTCKISHGLPTPLYDLPPHSFKFKIGWLSL